MASLGRFLRRVASLAGEEKRHWLVELQGPERLWMLNPLTKEQQVVDIGIPGGGPSSASSSPPAVLCSYQGQLLLHTGGNRLILGDPLRNQWHGIPSPPFNVCVAAFSGDGTSTLFASDEGGDEAGTLSSCSGQWTLGLEPEEKDNLKDVVSRPVWYRDAFYAQFERWTDDLFPCHSCLARYEPVNERRWRDVRVDMVPTKDQWVHPFEWQGKLLLLTEFDYVEDKFNFVYELTDDVHDVAGFESFGKLRKTVVVPGLDQEIRSHFARFNGLAPTLEQALKALRSNKWDARSNKWLVPEEQFSIYGGDGVLICDSYYGKLLMYSDLAGCRRWEEIPAVSYSRPPSRCYHVAGLPSASLKRFMGA